MIFFGSHVLFVQHILDALKDIYPASVFADNRSCQIKEIDKSHSKQTGGTGLGLAIVKHIVAKHNGDISLESEYGKGTKITVWIPV